MHTRLKILHKKILSPVMKMYALHVRTYVKSYSENWKRNEKKLDESGSKISFLSL